MTSACLLLPPSETKNRGGRGRPLSWDAVDELSAGRSTVVAALDAALGLSLDVASAALLLPPGLARTALEDNRQVRQAPTMMALRRYAGVLYDGIAAGSLTPSEHRVLARSVLVFSGLLGVVRGVDAVPAYRVPAKAVLPGIGTVSTFWRPILDEVVPGLLGTGAIVDLRSSDYVAMWRPRGPLAERTIAVRIVSPLPRGGVGVISYASKFAKGRLCAALARRISAGATIAGAQDIINAWQDCEGADARHISPNRLELTTT